MEVMHRGMEAFQKGKFGNSGANLFVDAKGIMRRISEQDLNGDGHFDIIFPNSHGYIERGKTTVFTNRDGKWEPEDLPNDSCWDARAVDLDGDGYEELIVMNAENGVTSDLDSYVYWGGKDGLTGERSVLPTEGGYDVAAIDLTGNGMMDLVFTSAWHDHHYPGFDYLQKIYVQETPHVFRDATKEYALNGNGIVSMAVGCFRGDGQKYLVLTGYGQKTSPDASAKIFRITENGFEEEGTELPTQYASDTVCADLFGTGYPDLIFTGYNRVVIYRNREGRFSADDKIVFPVKGAQTQFIQGKIPLAVDDIDADGIQELIFGGWDGIEIRKADDLDHVWQRVPGFYCTGLRTFDFRGDGKKDIFACVYATVKSYDTDSFLLHYSENGYSTENADRLPTHGAMSAEIADLDHDGKPEIIVCNTMGGPYQGDPEFPVFCYYGSQDHIYREENRVSYPVLFGAYSYTAGDVDNDGYPELIVTTGNTARIFKGTANGVDPENYYDVTEPFSRIPGGVILADLNHNGYLDLIMTNYRISMIPPEKPVPYDPRTVCVFWGGPNGFSGKNVTLLPAELGCGQAAVLVDVNGDGYLDLCFGTVDGDIGIIYGNEHGFDETCRPKFIKVKNSNGAPIIGLTAADINGDGKPELISTSAGHYTKRKSYLNFLYDPGHEYPEEKQFSVDVGGTTGYVSFADLRNCGCLDLILPFYSTEETRVLPMRIIRNDGRGNFDFDHPLRIECDSSIASFPVDLDHNGYPDLLVCCHRNDIGHTVQSLLFHNGPEGLDLEHPQKLWAYGPHDFTRNVPFNIMDRTESEYYESEVMEFTTAPEKISWEAECPGLTELRMRVRFAQTPEKLAETPWSEPVGNGSTLTVPEGAAYMQYQAEFYAPAACGSPRLSCVRIG